MEKGSHDHRLGKGIRSAKVSKDEHLKTWLQMRDKWRFDTVLNDVVGLFTHEIQ